MNEGQIARVRNMKRFLPLIVVIVFVVSIVGNVLLFRSVSALKADPEKQAREEMLELVEVVGKLIVLPADEEPTIATVAEPEKLKEQAFFANASVGDKVLLYTTAKKAILFNPTTGKIVEVAPINIGEGAAPAEDTTPGTETAE